MDSILQAVIGLSNSKTYVSGASYGISILAGIALLVLVPIVLAEVLHK
jgi:hypothetical protein